MIDLRWTLRSLRRAPGFTIVFVAVAALGTGATTTAFTLLNHVLIRPLPFPRPDELVALQQTWRAAGDRRTDMTPANLEDWRTMNHSFDAVGGYAVTRAPLTLTGRGEPRRLDAVIVDAGFFETLGVRPVVGRVFTAEEDRDGASPFGVVLSHRLAVSIFGSAAAAQGGTVTVDQGPVAAIGVMPAGFSFPARDVDLWLPMRTIAPAARTRDNQILSGIARLRPGVSIAAARADMDVVAKQLESSYPKDNTGVGAAVVELRALAASQSWTVVVAVFGAACCLMLVTCTNLASLLFARAVARRHEVAVRMAIGAGRDRMVKQFLTESLVLAVAGAAVGVSIAVVARPLLAFLIPAALPLDDAIPPMDWRVLAFAAALALITAVAFGVAPSYWAARHADFVALRSHSTAGRRSNRFRSALVITEIAATVVLVVAVGLLLKSLWRVQAVDPGFRPEGVLTLQTSLSMGEPPESRQAFYQRVLSEARRLPGVVAAGYVSFLPMTMTANAGNLGVAVPGPGGGQSVLPAHIRFVTPDLFKALGVPLLRGRDLSAGDHDGAPFAAVINESLAERLWPGQDPLGREIYLPFGRELPMPFPRDIAQMTPWSVVGVVGNVAMRGLEAENLPQVYMSAGQLPRLLQFWAPRDLVVRASVDPIALAPALRQIVHDAKPYQAVSGIRLLDDVVEGQTAPRRAQLEVLTAFALVAIVLAGVGIHGLLAFTVSLRTQEIGVRMALGAERGQVLTMIVRQGVGLAAAGIMTAAPIAYAAARLMTSLLFGVTPGDLPVYVAAAAIGLLMALTGSLRPALRAAGVDPARTIRGE